MSNHMELWNTVCKTDPATVKNAKVSGRTITAIDAQSQRKNATKTFGPYGIGWGVEPETESTEVREIDGIYLATYRAVMFYKWQGEVGRLPITADIKMSYVTKNGSGYRTVDDEFSKKVQTNAITKGLSTLGFNSDVFEKKFDDNKYVATMQDEFFYISQDEMAELEGLIQKVKADKAKFLQFMKVDAIGAIPRHDFQKARSALLAKQRSK